MMQRKNKVKPAGPSLSSVISPVSSIEDDSHHNNNKPTGSLLRKTSDDQHDHHLLLGESSKDGGGNNNNEKKSSSLSPSKNKVVAAVATVKRSTCGTSPFDKHWLNLDCCGLICATLTYMLHMYGVYAFGWILLPPWFSVMDEDGYRTLTFGCTFHRTLFILIASLAVFAHFKAMTTDPGAVPPDANPLPDPEELECLIKGEESPTIVANRKSMPSSSSSKSPLMMQEDTTQQHHQPQPQSNNNSLRGGPQAIMTHPATTALGAAAVVVGGVAGAVATVASSAAPHKPTTPSTNHQHGPNCHHNHDNPPITPSSSNSNNNSNANNNKSSLPQRGRRMCRRCQAYKPPRAHHCSICKRCIIKMDHHCPWVNNCVGIGNHKYFLLFIFYTCLSCVYSLSFLGWRFVHCVGGGPVSHHRPRCVDHPTDLLPLIGLTVEAILFGLFTLCMMCDQWDVVMTNLTHIDRLKGHDTLQYRVQAGINEVFGTGSSRYSMTSSSTSSSLPHHHHHVNYRRGFHYTWLSPLHKVCFPETVRDDIFGYCRPVGSGSGRRRSQNNHHGGIEMTGAEIV